MLDDKKESEGAGQDDSAASGSQVSLAWCEWALPPGKEPFTRCPLPRWQGSGMACQDQTFDYDQELFLIL